MVKMRYCDFTELRFPNSYGATANDLGFIMQHTGYLEPFNWSYTEKERVKVAKK